MNPSTRWNPETYQRFGDQRLRPAIELISRIPATDPLAKLIYDLGSGTGTATCLLAERFPGSKVIGVDHSEEMLATAREQDAPVTWQHGDIAEWQPDSRPDVIISNAALHWLPDHASLLPRLLGTLAPAGCLAVQMPMNWSAPSHQLMRTILATGSAKPTDDANARQPIGSEELRQKLSRPPVHEMGIYHDLLKSAGASQISIWETEYLQILTGEDPVLNWVSGAGLRPVLEGLDEPQRGQFLDCYAAALREAYPLRPDGTTLFPFRRLFIVAIR